MCTTDMAINCLEADCCDAMYTRVAGVGKELGLAWRRQGVWQRALPLSSPAPGPALPCHPQSPSCQAPLYIILLAFSPHQLTGATITSWYDAYAHPEMLGMQIYRTR